MGPISLSFAESQQAGELSDEELVAMVKKEKKSMQSIHSMSTEDWRSEYEKDGMVDLWVEEEFNAGSRLKVCTHLSKPVSPSVHLQSQLYSWLIVDGAVGRTCGSQRWHIRPKNW